MTPTQRHPYDTRIWVTNEGKDIHLPKLDQAVSQSFEFASIFDSNGLSFRDSVKDQTNSYRIDEMGATKVKGRKAGEEIEIEKIPNDMKTIIVDTMEYNRVTLDWMDNWTSPRRIEQIGKEKGIAMAHTYDLNHLVTLIKGGDYKPNATLKATGAFNDGVSIKIDNFSTYDAKVQAQAIREAHAYLVDTFIKRRVPVGNLVTLVSTEWYSLLVGDEILTNTQFQGNTNTNNKIERRITTINGIRVMEMPLFLNGERDDAPMGDAFNLGTEHAKANMIVFDPTVSLLTIDAYPLYNDHFDKKEAMAQYLDTYRMYTVALRRGDAIGVVHADAGYNPDTSGKGFVFVPPVKGGAGTGEGGGLGG